MTDLPGYRSYGNRVPDRQYSELLYSIVRDGIKTPTRQGVSCLSLPRPAMMHFDLRNGAPVITERDVSGFWQKPIDELFAFVNGIHSEPVLRKDWGVSWWGEWATPEKTIKRGFAAGDIGPRGSYGPAFHDYPSPDGVPFDQFLELVSQIRLYPDDRRHMVTNWLPPFVFRTRNADSEVTIAPCHGSLVYVRILNGELYLRMVQRSGDVPVGVPSNMIQYTALALALGQVTGFPARAFSHIILDPHIYTDQLEAVELMIARAPYRFGCIDFASDSPPADIHDYRSGHFLLREYGPHQPILGIPVAT
jgi:thymidylate synthase